MPFKYLKIVIVFFLIKEWGSNKERIFCQRPFIGGARECNHPVTWDELDKLNFYLAESLVKVLGLINIRHIEIR